MVPPVGDEEVARAIHRHTPGATQAGEGRGAPVAAKVRRAVFPATVVMMLEASTFLMRCATPVCMPRAPTSEMKTFPAPSTATAWGLTKRALVAGPPSPTRSKAYPATVVIVPEGSTFRMRPLSAMMRLPSARNRFPAPSTTTALGKRSPLATVLMMPGGSTFRTRCPSAMKRFPAPSTVTPPGESKLAAVAGPPSPPNPWVWVRARARPFPATVLMMPAASTFRMRWLSWSAMKRFPALSTATPPGAAKLASVAGPPSPLKPDVPFPATVVMTPEESTFLIRWFWVSAMKRFPAPSTARPRGNCKVASVAGPPSPTKPGRPLPPPATVVMGSGRVHLPDALAVAVCNEDVSRTIHRHTTGAPQAGAGGRTGVAGKAARANSSPSNGGDDAGGVHLPDALVLAVSDKDVSRTIHRQTAWVRQAGAEGGTSVAAKAGGNRFRQRW